MDSGGERERVGYKKKMEVLEVRRRNIRRRERQRR